MVVNGPYYMVQRGVNAASPSPCMNCAAQVTSQLFVLGSPEVLQQLGQGAPVQFTNTDQPTPPQQPWLVRYSAHGAQPVLRLVHVDCPQVGLTRHSARILNHGQVHLRFETQPILHYCVISCTLPSSTGSTVLAHTISIFAFWQT